MSLDQEVAALAQVAALKEFEPDALRLLAFAAPRLNVEAGDIVFEAGDPAAGAIVLLEGAIGLYPDAMAAVAERVAGPLMIIDELAMFVDTDRMYHARALSFVTIAIISRDLVRRVLSEFPDSAETVRDGIARRLSGLTSELSVIAQQLEALDGET